MPDAAPNAVLRDGPSSLPLAERIRYVENLEDEVKLLSGNHYDHFEPTSHVEKFSGRDLRVFVWTGFTCVAE